MSATKDGLKRYHLEVFFHGDIGVKFASLLSGVPPKLRYSRHAMEETVRDRYCTIPVLTREALSCVSLFEGAAVKLIEYYMDGMALDRVVVRVSSESGDTDFVYVVDLLGTVRTCWVNKKDDAHGTLDRGLYETA